MCGTREGGAGRKDGKLTQRRRDAEGGGKEPQIFWGRAA